MTRSELLTVEAAHLVGVQPTSFRTWARRRGLRPCRVVRVGKRTAALWDAEQLADARRMTCL